VRNSTIGSGQPNPWQIEGVPVPGHHLGAKLADLFSKRFYQISFRVLACMRGTQGVS
jgi:hypothetical protein